MWYLLGEEIARGGMGEVYRADDAVLGREVAVKVLQAKYPLDSPTARRFADDLTVRVAREGAEEFAALVRERKGSVDGWLNQADAIPTLRAFAAGLRRDGAAVRAGLSLPWSNGPVERQMNRPKLPKRAGYDRAGFDLLRARVLYAD